MKKYACEFFRRGFIACGIGPVVLAVIYIILHICAGVETLSVAEVCVGIISLTALAFVAGGMNSIYQIERLPLMLAVLIHGCVLYISYLITYLVNGWLNIGKIPILVFSGIFIVGYFAIWAIIYRVIKKSTADLNEKLRQKQEKRKI